MWANRPTFYWQGENFLRGGAVSQGQEKYALDIGVDVATKETMIYIVRMIVKAAVITETKRKIIGRTGNKNSKQSQKCQTSTKLSEEQAKGNDGCYPPQLPVTSVHQQIWPEYVQVWRIHRTQ